MTPAVTCTSAFVITHHECQLYPPTAGRSCLQHRADGNTNNNNQHFYYNHYHLSLPERTISNKNLNYCQIRIKMSITVISSAATVLIVNDRQKPRLKKSQTGTGKR